MNHKLMAVMLQQKVRLPNKSGSPLISNLCETVKALETFHGDSEKASVATQHDHLDTLCIVALENLGRSKVLELLQESRPVSAADFENEVSMLAPAAAVGKISIMRDLVKESALLPSRCNLFGYPLHAAAIGGHEAAAKFLVNEGANIEAIDNFGSGTALCLAARFGRDGVVRVLLEKGAKYVFEPMGMHALHHAMGNGGHEAVINSLLHHGASINAKTSTGETALHFAANIGTRESVVNLLLDQGANLEAMNNRSQTPLCVAAKSKREDMVKFLLARGADIQSIDKEGHTILHRVVVDEPKSSLIELLIDNGIEPDARDEQGETVLHLAVKRRQKTTVKVLLKKGADIHAISKGRMSSLHMAVDSYTIDEALIKLLLQQGADISARTHEGKEALHISAGRGYENLVRLLLDEGANVNAAALGGETALHFAASRGHMAVFQLLLERGADVRARSGEGITPLHLAAASNEEVIVCLLLGKGADPKLQTTGSDGRICKGATALHLAASNRDLIDLLLKHGAELEAADASGWTVLFHAVASKNSTSTVPHLVDLGADINRADRRGNTVLHLKARCGSSGLVRILCERGVLVDTRNAGGETALHIAAEGYNTIAQILLDQGADVNARDNSGRTALHRAASWSNGHEASMRVLIERGIDREIKDELGLSATDLFRGSNRDEESIESVISSLAAL